MPGPNEPSILGLAALVSARPVLGSAGGGRLCIALPSKRRWRLHVRLEAVVAALLLNSVLLLFVAQMVLAPESATVPAVARTNAWAPITLLGAAVLADLALYATLFTRRDPLDLWFDERGVEVRSGPDIVQSVAASDIRGARWWMSLRGWAILEVEVGEAGHTETIRLAHIGYAGVRGPDEGRPPWSSTELDALVALLEALARQASGRRGSAQDVPALLQQVRERAGTANGG